MASKGYQYTHHSGVQIQDYKPQEEESLSRVLTGHLILLKGFSRGEGFRGLIGLG